MNADDFRDYMLSFLFLRYLSDNYEAAGRRELGSDYPDSNAIGNGGRTPLSVWYDENPDDVVQFEQQMRRKVHYVVQPQFLWSHIVHLAQTLALRHVEPGEPLEERACLGVLACLARLGLLCFGLATAGARKSVV